MKLVLDSNIFIADFWLRGTQFALLKDGIQRIGGELVVPEVVMAEVRAKYRERLSEAVRAEEKAAKHVADLMGPGAAPGQFRDLESSCKAHGEQMARELKSVGVRLLPIPAISHSEILERALAKTRPFDGEGRGYRDALIWETVLTLVREAAGQVCFVSADSDFGTDAGLHADLGASLERTGNAAAFEFHRSLAAFNEKWIHPALERLDDLVARLNRGEGADVKGAVLEGLRQSLVADEDMAYLGLGFPHGSVGVWVKRETVQPKRFDVDDARQLSTGPVVVDASITFTIALEISVHPFGTEQIPVEVRREWEIHPGSDFSVEIPDVELTAWCSVHLGGPEHSSVEAVEMRMLEGRNGSTDLEGDQWTPSRPKPAPDGSSSKLRSPRR